MKLSRYFILIAIATFTTIGCSTTQQIPQEDDGGFTLRGIDFREYSEQGFLFTTRPPTGEYGSKGILTLTLYPIIERLRPAQFDNLSESETVTKTVDGEETTFSVRTFRISQGGSTFTAYYGVQVLDLNDAIDQMYNTAVEFDANAVTELDLSRETRNNNGLLFEVIEVSGFAIKRVE